MSVLHSVRFAPSLFYTLSVLHSFLFALRAFCTLSALHHLFCTICFAPCLFCTLSVCTLSVLHHVLATCRVISKMMREDLSLIHSRKNENKLWRAGKISGTSLGSRPRESLQRWLLMYLRVTRKRKKPKRTFVDQGLSPFDLQTPENSQGSEAEISEEFPFLFLDDSSIYNSERWFKAWLKADNLDNNSD